MVGLDFYESIKFVNYIRSQVKSGNLKPDVSSASFFSDDRYLQPVLEDDALLFSLDDLSSSQAEDESVVKDTGEISAQEKITELEKQLDSARHQFHVYQLQVEETLEKRWNEAEGTSRPKASVSTIKDGETKSDGIDFEGDYFESYSYNGSFSPCP